MTSLQPAAKPGLLQASGQLFLMMMGANACNYAFHALASRNLGPADYGALVSMIALLTIMAVPSQTIQTVVAKKTALEDLEGHYDRIAAVMVRVLRRMLMLGAVCLAGLALASLFLADFFRLASPWPIIAVGVTTIVMLIIPVLRGVLQGLQRFNALGFNLIADGLFRLSAGALVFWLGFRVTGGVLASALGGALACLVAMLGLPKIRREFGRPLPALDLSQLKLYSLSVLAGFGAFLVISTLDVIMVKHLFEPRAAGYYAAASMVGKAFLFLPFAMAHVLFPKVSAGQARGEDTEKLLFKSLLLNAGVLMVSIVLAWFLAPLIILTLFGRVYLLPQTLLLVRFFGLAITPLALVYILLQYNLALNNTRFLVWLLLDIPVLVTLLVFFHSRPDVVLLVTGLNHALLFLGGLVLTPWRRA